MQNDVLDFVMPNTVAQGQNWNEELLHAKMEKSGSVKCILYSIRPLVCVFVAFWETGGEDSADGDRKLAKL